MYLSRIQLNDAIGQNSQLGLLLKDRSYGIHRLLHDLFSGNERFLFREEIANDASEIREIINDPVFVSNFGTLDGEQLKTSPKGFDKEHPDVDLLRYKQFIFGRNFSDEEVLNPNFLEEANKTFQAMRPFFDYMSDVLTTDSNGESIL